jgi:AcrR family transcriptional regulator
MVERTQAERSATTIGELVAHARQLFATRGYQKTSIEDIVRHAGVTRGALYHHFDGKLAVFKAVFSDIQRELVEHTTRVALEASGGPLDQLEAGCQAFIDFCADPGVRQVFLVDGFTVIGWYDLRQLEADHTLAALRVAVDRAISAGEVAPRPAEPLVAMLFGGLCETAMLIANADHPTATRRAVRDEIHRTVQALRPPA